MTTIRVLIVEDSLTVRKYLFEILSADPAVVVIGEARGGAEAIELCSRLRPDVVTVDMVLDGMSGLEATEQIMAFCPTPILIVSAASNRGDLYRTYDALAAGAVEVLEKPSGSDNEGRWAREFLATIKLVSRIKVITHSRGKLAAQRIGREPVPSDVVSVRPRAIAATFSVAPELVVMGTSTGGPAALLQVLGGLHASFSLPILFVLHIGEPFGQALADWLATNLRRVVTVARDGEALPRPGEAKILMAPANRHLQVSQGLLRLSDAPERHSCRPAVDVLFESVALELGPRVVACLLTGMGRDGAAGMLAIKEAGGLTLAQDEATSTVFGMPREAILMGAATRVLPLEGFAGALNELDLQRRCL